MEHSVEGRITKETLPKLGPRWTVSSERQEDSTTRDFVGSTTISLKLIEVTKTDSGHNNLVSMQRNAKKKFMFSDGTVIPPGAKVGTPLLFLHRDPSISEDPDVFDGFRFSRLREESGGDAEAVKHSMISTDPAYQLFGHGKHAW